MNPHLTPYLIVGNGRLANHFKNYFTLLNIPFLAWTRNSAQTNEYREKHIEDDFYLKAHMCERILVLISDSAILPFIKSRLNSHADLRNKIWIHCSGSISLTDAECAHPLSTFGTNPYSLDSYQKIPFVLEENRAPFLTLFPHLKNPHFFISCEKKSLYHALCVMSGNFTTMLWQNTFTAFEEKLDLPKEILFSYLQHTTQNLIESPKQALTGPISRGDTKTILSNLESLQNTPEQSLYYAFLNFVLAKNKSGEQIHEYPRL